MFRFKVLHSYSNEIVVGERFLKKPNIFLKENKQIIERLLYTHKTTYFLKERFYINSSLLEGLEVAEQTIHGHN